MGSTVERVEDDIRTYIKNRSSSGTPLFFMRDLHEFVQRRGSSSHKATVTKAYNSLISRGYLLCMVVNKYKKMHVIVGTP